MEVIETIDEFRTARSRACGPLGLVPTMGFLHEGHIALLSRARSENASVAASTFVNPAQFGPHEDYAAYPRDLVSDLSKLEHAGVDLVFAPSVDEMYPKDFDTQLEVGRVADRLEGQARPGHFRGVAVAVCKLLSIVRPERAYFGQKDAQQCLVVERLNADLNLGTEIVVVPTVREDDGLALSSRNMYLGPAERKAASVIYRSLCLAKSLWESGVIDTADLRRQMHVLIENEPLACIEYVSIADVETLEELSQVKGPALVSLAVRIGQSRLIDNLILRLAKACDQEAIT